MIRGIFTGASGMLAEMTRTDVIANNLSNITTSGFKKDKAIFRAYPEMNIHRIHDPVEMGINRIIDPRPFIGMMGTGVLVDEVNTDFSQGPIEITSNPLDLALRGEGFFAVQTPAGIRYTRDGSFSLNQDGQIVTKEGYYVLGQEGAISIGQTEKGDIKINGLGEIFVGDQFVDRIMVVTFEDNDQLQKQGDNLYSADLAAMPSEAGVIQGALEKSNVNTIAEMVNLIEAFRAYEASQKVITTHDDTLNRAVNDIARL